MSGLELGQTRPGFRSGFVSLVGRPNAGKSTLLNQILGTKVAITSATPQTTRAQVRGVLQRPDAQVVFVDTPGLHRPRSALGEHLNAAATDALIGVDVVCVVVDATAPIGAGDQWVVDHAPRDAVTVMNKCDVASPDQIAQQLVAAGAWDLAEYFPVSARTGEGVDVLVDALVARLPLGPAYYPPGTITDVSEAVQLAELVREQLLRRTRDELPHSIHTRVTEWEWPRVRCEIVVERDSQKGMVIGKGGRLLKEVGIAVRREFNEDMFLELHVTVDRHWQRRPGAVERLLDPDAV